ASAASAAPEARASVFATRRATNFMSSPLAPDGGRNISEALRSSSGPAKQARACSQEKHAKQARACSQQEPPTRRERVRKKKVHPGRVFAKAKSREQASCRRIRRLRVVKVPRGFSPEGGGTAANRRELQMKLWATLFLAA